MVELYHGTMLKTGAKNLGHVLNCKSREWNMSNKPTPVHVECIHLLPFNHWRPEMKAFGTCTDMTRKQEEQTGEEGLMDVCWKDKMAGVKQEMGGNIPLYLELKRLKM